MRLHCHAADCHGSTDAAMRLSCSGDVWRALEALFEAAGYLLHLQRACASWWQATETRKRAWALLVRKDAFPSLGFPAPLPIPAPKHRRLQDILTPAAEVEHMFHAHRLYAELNNLAGKWADDFDEVMVGIGGPAVALASSSGATHTHAPGPEVLIASDQDAHTHNSSSGNSSSSSNSNSGSAHSSSGDT